MSSAFASLSYDENTGITTAVFHSGGVYTWSTISKEIFDEWYNSSSWGRYFHDNIKDQYT